MARLKKFSLFLLFSLSIGLGYRIIQYNTNLIVDNYFTHCCFSDFCKLTLQSYNTNVNIRLSNNQCLILDKNDTIRFNSLRFFSEKQSYEVMFRLLDCSIDVNETVLTIRCNKEHRILVSNQLLTDKEQCYDKSKYTNYYTTVLNCGSNSCIYYVYLDCFIIKSVLLYKVNVYTSVSDKKEYIYVNFRANTDLRKCCLQFNNKYFEIVSNSNCIENIEKDKKYSFVLKRVNGTNSIFSGILQCEDKKGNKYSFSVVEKYEHKETFNEKLLAFIMDKGLLILIAIAGYLLWKEWEKHREKLKSAKQQLEEQ